MGPLTIIFTMSIIIMLIIFVVLLCDVPVTKPLRIVGYIVVLPAFLGAMLLASTMGEIERLQKEKVEKYEQITYTVYKKI
jgi:hypothetical protein